MRSPSSTRVFHKTVSAKGQLLIPKHAREGLGIRPGDRLLLDVVDGALIVAHLRRSIVDHTAGSLRRFVADGKSRMREPKAQTVGEQRGGVERAKEVARE